ncbi:hypothetical protein LY76DRAFT_597676 [Colletotrichum caudatum]|nr:hypothetical protein LY76DRAFT_597676 [Colletotrichum caudatum]
MKTQTPCSPAIGMIHFPASLPSLNACAPPSACPLDFRQQSRQPAATYTENLAISLRRQK